MQTLRAKLFGDLRAQRGAFFAVWITIVLGLTFYGATYPAGIGMIESFTATYTQYAYHDFTTRFEPAPRAEVQAAFAGLDAAAAQTRLVIDAGLALYAPDRITLRLIATPGDGHPVVNDYLVTQGRDLSGPDEVLVLESFATFHGITPGDVLRVVINDAPVDLTVAGLIFTPEYLVPGQSLLMPFPLPSSFGVGVIDYERLSTLAGQEGMVNDAAFLLAAGADPEAFRADLEAAAAPFAPDGVWSRVQTPSGGVLDANIRGDMNVATFFSAMFLAIGGLVTAVLLARLMEAETRRIGTMRALGLDRAALLRHYLTFPLALSAAGGIVGSVLGYLASFMVSYVFIQTLAGGSLPTFVNRPQWGYILFGWLVTLTLALLASALPTWRASGTDPGLALRPAMPKGLGAQAQVEAAFLPLTARLALRNLLRAPSRTLNTMLGVVIGGTVIIAASISADSVLRSNEVQLIDGIHYNLQVTWGSVAPAGLRLAQVEAVPGVEAVEMALAGPVTAEVSHSPVQALDTVAIAIDHNTDFYTFETLAGEPALAHADGVWVGHNLARVLGLAPGDTLTLTALGQTHNAAVRGVVNVGVGSPVYVPMALMTSWTPGGIAPSTVAYVRAAPESVGDVRRALAALPGVTSVEDIATNNDDLLRYMSMFTSFSYIFQSFGYLLTLTAIFNTVSVNLHERREELAIMRAMGAGLGEIARAVTWETVSVTLFGLLLSVPFGLLAGSWLVGNYELDFFGMLPYIYPASALIAVVGVLAVVALAEWINLRGLRRADLGYLSKTLST